MSGIRYRQAEIGDIDQLVAMRWEFQTESDEVRPKLPHETFLTNCRDFLIAGLSGSWTYWVADEGGTIVSHAFVQRVAMVPNPDRIKDEWGYVTNCYTVPHRRGEGIGTRLLENLVAWAGEMQLELLVVWPSDESVSFYKRIGFLANNEIMQLTLR